MSRTYVHRPFEVVKSKVKGVDSELVINRRYVDAVKTTAVFDLDEFELVDEFRDFAESLGYETTVREVTGFVYKEPDDTHSYAANRHTSYAENRSAFSDLFNEFPNSRFKVGNKPQKRRVSSRLGLSIMDDWQKSSVYILVEIVRPAYTVENDYLADTESLPHDIWKVFNNSGSSFDKAIERAEKSSDRVKNRLELQRDALLFNNGQLDEDDDFLDDDWDHLAVDLVNAEDDLVYSTSSN